MSSPQIIATGRCVPERVVTNEEMSSQIETSDQWVYSRTGIHSRRFCTTQTGLDLAYGAARQALDRAEIKPEEIGICLAATFSPDYASPSTACLLQERLGLQEDTVCFDLNAACAGFLYGLKTAHALLADSQKPYALVVGCEYISRLLDMNDRSTCVLFGDGAGAVILRREESRTWRTVFGSRGDASSIWVPGPGPERSTIHMEGKPVFRFATQEMERTIRTLLEAEHRAIEEIDWVVCHQANARIIDHVVKKLNGSPERFYKNMERYGNTSAASIPIALDELCQSGDLRSGMKIICVGFGGGLTWGGALWEW